MVHSNSLNILRERPRDGRLDLTVTIYVPGKVPGARFYKVAIYALQSGHICTIYQPPEKELRKCQKEEKSISAKRVEILSK